MSTLAPKYRRLTEAAAQLERRRTALREVAKKYPSDHILVVDAKKRLSAAQEEFDAANRDLNPYTHY